MKLRALILALVALMPLSASAVTLDFPGAASRAAEESTPLASYALPVGPWADGAVATITAEGAVIKQAWQIQGDGLTTLQILKPLREQLNAAGFTVLFECDSEACGGFDFRYAHDILPEPAMHVDLGDFRVISARRHAPEGAEFICLLVSRSSTRGFVQLVHVMPEAGATPVAVTSTKTPDAAEVAPGSLAKTLETRGHLVLEDVSFATGTSQLAEDSYDSLTELAAYLIDHPNRAITLVGHTDAEGSLAGNVALSRKRAAAVARHLTGALAVPARQVASDGVGFLAPMASNLTDDGREVNRRVEVILTSTQ